MFVYDFFNSLKAYGKAWLLIKRLNLYHYFFIPALIGLFLGTCIVLFAWSISQNVIPFIENIWTFSAGKDIAVHIGRYLSIIIIVIIGFIVFKHLVLALSAPFMSGLSEKIETHITGNTASTSKSFFYLLIRGIRLNLRNLFWELFFTILLLLLSLIPLLNILAYIIILYIQSYYAGFGNMDYTMERYFSYKNSIKFIKNNKGIAVGNGLLFITFLMLPIVGIIVTLPLSTAASTISVMEKLNDNKLLN